MKTTKQNANALSSVCEKSQNKKLELIKSTNAKKIKQLKISFKNEVEIYSYIKDGLLFGFCTVKPSTDIRWHYQFSNLEELQSSAQFTIIQNLRKQLINMRKTRSKITYK